MIKGWELGPEELEFLGKPEYYNYRCQDCRYEEEVMDVACILDAEREGEPEELVCPKCGGDFIWTNTKSPPEGR
ncbi:MAG: hypothetical protein A3G93_07925 [Nitrospinae bacterium RIFCSPLOWO2_12_FULL_45_22]|nr:MAG: hypothetical protein A3G93_07925 [Nitrospinae bacterium RIFCSPLOWO2_12_FULL_45_22]